ncbi:ABC polyamine transporter, periplasmic substrate-binding protein [Oceaniovalibus guishaninsula JLT2003]|uniref:ABC polyamine transporter, periplasmic substrate-binding protein n=1 Tax=Oceaniovalibus guishaninsula JLT2003 TaxID=1231392 RepID=K2HBR7_9RHOB|nr:ABC transporter substrate-binding protein [Oceaniovalibus guishaninsula]EKE44052.1 ABC polyamine transporter, periplasmic substrate-binding protein [Oceaniovalibus guishaninsula JLT2003]
MARRTTALVTLSCLAAPAMAEDGDLLILDYSGFENPAFHQPYIDQHGASPTYSFFGDEEEAFQKLRSGFEADIAHICAGSVSKWEASDLLEPWDTARIDAFDDLDTDLTGSDVTADLDQVTWVPTDFGTTGIAYNTDEVPAEAVASLNVFLDPAYSQRVAIPDNVDDAFALAYLATGTTDWRDASDAQFQAAADWLRQAHENLRTYWTGPAELAQLMATGDVLVAWAWNETLPTMAAQDFPIGFQREPAEGSSLWLCGYVNLKDGPGSADKAYDYLNAMLSEAAAPGLLDAGFGSANSIALNAQGAEALQASGLGPVDVPLLAQLPIDADQRARHSEAFEKIKAGF